jgi:hypothetical protein
MKKIIITLCAVAMIGTSFVGTSTQAKANDVGVGIAAGIVGGTILGAAIASQPRRPVVVEEHRVYEDEPVVVCHRVRMEDEYGNRYWKRVCRQD